MTSVNKVILIGNLGRDPELKKTESSSILNFSLATSRRLKDKSGQYASETEWHTVVAFGRTAEIIAEYCKKGSPLFIEGRLRTQKWRDQNGNDRFRTEVICESVQLLSTRGIDQHQTPVEHVTTNTDSRVATSQELDEDIPF